MISTTALIKGIATIGAIGSLGWVFDVPNEARDYVSEPLRAEIKEVVRQQTTIMASMKHYDVRTDELAADVRTKNTNMKAKEKYIEDHLSSSVLSPQDTRTKMFLEHQLDTDRKEMELKLDLLKKALGGEALLLQRLSQG